METLRIHTKKEKWMEKNWESLKEEIIELVDFYDISSLNITEDLKLIKKEARKMKKNKIINFK